MKIDIFQLAIGCKDRAHKSVEVHWSYFKLLSEISEARKDFSYDVLCLQKGQRGVGCFYLKVKPI